MSEVEKLVNQLIFGQLQKIGSIETKTTPGLNVMTLFLFVVFVVKLWLCRARSERHEG